MWDKVHASPSAPPHGIRRLPPLPRPDLTVAQRELYDAIVGGPRASGPQTFALVGDDGCLTGPFGVFLLQPRLGQAVQGLGSAIRYETALSARSREIAILLVAAHCDSAFERYAHEGVGRHIGLTETEIDSLRCEDVGTFVGIEGVVARTTLQLLRSGDLGEDEFVAAVEQLGREGLFELSTLVGYYVLLAVQLRIFRVLTPTR